MLALKFDLQLFATGAGNNVHTTAGIANANTGNVEGYNGTGLSAEMKTYYSDYLIDMAEPKLVHDQFGQKEPIPKNRGKIVEFRKYDPLPKALTPLKEGVTPDGQKLNMSTVTAEVKQYGAYVEISDILQLAAIDNNLVQATKLLGGQAGRTLDTIVREVLNGGTNVQYAEGQVSSRSALVGEDEGGNNHYLTVNAVRMAVRTLKRYNAETIDGSYVGVIHPDVSYDLMSDPKWVNVKTYSDPEGIYNGEIGKIENVRFVESTEAKIFEKAGAGGRDVYSTLIIGENAYGSTELAGGGLQHIVKQLGSAGTADPLEQRATAGWKATKAAVRLVENYMVRIETASSMPMVEE
jgi:N4-gp56 family major capsid protein